MKTLIITLDYPPNIGGVASYLYNFLRHVPNPRDYVVYAPKQSGGEEFDKKNAWTTYRRSQYFMFWPHWLRMIFHVWRIVEKEDIKEIYLHQALPGGYVGWFFLRLKGIPYTVFLHGSDVIMASKTPWKIKMMSFVLGHAQRIITNSHFLENRVRGRFIFSAPMVVLYPCPSDTFFQKVASDKLTELKKQLALEGKKVVLTVSRMVDGKGYPHIIRLLTDICAQVPNVVWLFVGDGPKRQTIVDLVQKHYLQNVVRMLGAVPNDDLPQYYQVADVFVMLTHQDEDAEESWGSVFLEAGASALPVIAGRAGGVEEAVDHLRTGIIVDVYQEKAVVNAIVALLKNTAFAAELGRLGKERAEKEYRWDQQVQKI